MRAFTLFLSLVFSCCAYAATPQIVGGADHSLALSRDGRVFAWGDDSYGQLGSGRHLFLTTPVATILTDPGQVVDLAGGSYHSLARLRDGSVLAWGNNTNGQLGDGSVTSRGLPVKVTTLTSVIALAAGERHSLAADSRGDVWAWGTNEYGRLGQGDDSTLEDSKVPIKVLQLTNIKDVRAGREHSLALTRDGKVMSWGANYSGQLGDSTGRTRKLPVMVEFPLPDMQIVAIDASNDHSFALDSLGRLWSWGDNGSYQLGDNVYSLRSSPLYMGGLEQQGKVSTFSVGPSGGAAVLADGSLWVWGFYGRYEEPTRVTGLPGPVAQVRLGESHMVITLTDGRMLASGDNTYGQLGDGTEVSPDDLVFVVPKSVLGPVTLFTSGYYHTLALDASGRLMAWGDNSVGQLGNGVSISQSVPSSVSGLSGVTQIASGYYHALALLGDGTVRAWGYNGEGELGDKSDAQVRTGPVVAKGLAGIKRVAAGGYSSAALDTSGKLWAWGSNYNGQLTLPEDVYRADTPTLATGLPALADVSVGGEHMLGLDLQGRVWVWGANGYGQLGDGYNQATAPRMLSSLSNITAISAGGDHSMALDNQGRVWAWGDNGYLQVGPSEELQITTPMLITGLPPIKSISAGAYSSLVLANDGSLWAWGAGGEGQLGDGLLETRAAPARAGTDTYSVIGTGVLHALAVRPDGLPWSFGLNFSGQLGDGSYTNQGTPVGVVDAGLDRFFDLDTTVPNLPVAADKLPPFFAITQRSGSNRLLTLSSKLKLSPVAQPSQTIRGPRLAQTNYNVYVVALVPGAVIGQPHVAMTVWARSGVSNWGPYVGGPLAAYLSNVASGNDQTLLIDILDSTDLSTAVGTRFFIGYGTSSDEMLASGRFRLVYEVAAAVTKPAK
jgi:alpha-tubulin suppressor-like RCC1 family protein